MPAAEEAQREKGVAPIKKEYLIVRSTEPAVESPAATPTTEGNSESQPKRREKASGQNKNRKQKNKQVYKDSNRLCAQIALGNECKFGEKCTFSHDVDEFLAQRGPDLGDRCVLFDLYGQCRFGLR
ncbi:tRNA-dihydrouridine synthase 3, partial [Linderina macrospora]